MVLVFVEVTLVVRTRWAWEEKIATNRKMPNRSEIETVCLMMKSYEGFPKNQGVKCDKSMATTIR